MWLWLKSRVSLEQAEVGNGLREWLGGEDRTRLCRLLGSAHKPSSRRLGMYRAGKDPASSAEAGKCCKAPFQRGFLRWCGERQSAGGSAGAPGELSDLPAAAAELGGGWASVHLFFHLPFPVIHRITGSSGWKIL